MPDSVTADRTTATPHRPRRHLRRLGRLAAFGAAVALCVPVLVGTPAQAAAGVTVDADGQGAVIDSQYSTRLRVSGTGFQSVQGGHGGLYVWFGTVNGKWRPSQGGVSGKNYVYVPDSEARNNAGFQRFISFPGAATAESANGGVMRNNGSWAVDLLVPGPVFQGVGRNGSVTEVDCREVTCGVITIGAHGVKSARNETFTPVRIADLQSSDDEAPAPGDGPESVQPDSDEAPEVAGPDAVPTTTDAESDEVAAQGPAQLTVDHSSAYVGRAMSFTASGLTPGEQFTVVLDDGLAAVGPFLVGQDGTSSGVISIPANAGAGTHELRLFGASKEASVKFGVQGDQDPAPVSAQADDEREWVPVAFAGAAAVVFVVAVVVSVLRLRGGRRAEA